MFVVERLVSVIAPYDCLVCSEEGSLICNWCLPDAFEPVPSRCYKCYKQTNDSLVCATCKRTSGLKHVWVATEYDGLAKELIRRFKFERAQSADRLIAKILRSCLPYLSEHVIVPIPTASSRRRARGYDHTKLLAKQLASMSGLHNVSALDRLGQSRQVGSKRNKRLMQMRGAFAATNPSYINKKHVLLVDDIVTSGATLEEAAKTLKQAGAKSVSAAVFAQSQ